ncbi:uncharacterized protein [Nicotiana tomentosiformis]|uniref:uncharacterized protein n=1 Tax=Nicotiana tomentosiformis TaxID=4098 RepID=UPI00388C415F
MALKKMARNGQRANATPGVAVYPIPDDAGEQPRGEDNPPTTTLLDSTTPAQTAPIPTHTEGAAIPPLTDTPVPPPASASGPSVFDGDLRRAILMLAQIVASQAQISNVAPTSSRQLGDSASYRVNGFLLLDPPVFTGTDPEEDPQDIIDEMHKTLRVMCATETEVVELTSYYLKDVA